MKAIINKRLYDTETATFIGRYNNGYGFGDFNYIREELYRKKNGEYFIYGRGGAWTKYSESDGDWMSSGSRIIPLTVEAAEKWAEAHMSADDYLKCFEVAED